LRKQPTHSEDRVFPYFELADCSPELFKRIRRMAEHKQLGGHPWTNMSDEEIARSAGLYKTDIVTGKVGLTLAAALLLGKDETIMSALPHHKTDALLRVENLDRYDDRDDIRTNLIDSFDRLMAFIAKHLPDRFYLDGVHSISLRDRLFREIVSNLLIHREFANGFPAKLIIEKDRVYTENWSRPHGMGLIDPLHFAPFPKNPVIAKFFKEIGRVDELGSGVRNVFKYSPEYVPGAVPQLIEGDIFKTIVPLKIREVVTNLQSTDWESVRRKIRRKFVEKFGEKFVENWEKPLELIFHDRYTSAAAIAEKTGISARAVQKQLARMKNMGIIARVGADKGGYWRITLDE
jgi:ATP-dependent DNA helicase RecG